MFEGSTPFSLVLERVGPVTLFINCNVALLLNVSVVFLIGCASSLVLTLSGEFSDDYVSRAKVELSSSFATLHSRLSIPPCAPPNRTGVLKDILLVAGSVVLFGSPVTFTQVRSPRLFSASSSFMLTVIAFGLFLHPPSLPFFIFRHITSYPVPSLARNADVWLLGRPCWIGGIQDPSRTFILPLCQALLSSLSEQAANFPLHLSPAHSLILPLPHTTPQSLDDHRFAFNNAL